MQRVKVTFGLLIALAMAIAATPSAAQNGQRLRAWRERPVAAQRPNGNGGKGQPNARAMEGLPPKWVERVRDMPPEQQQRFLENNEAFRRLPPARQEQIRRNLEKWNQLTPEQKQQARRAQEALDNMTPEQRQYVRNVLLPKWQTLPQPRRQVINRHLAMLKQMSPSTQQEALNDPRFLQGLSPDEQSMLRDLNSLRNPAPPPVPQQ